MNTTRKDQWPLVAFIFSVLLGGFNGIGVRYTVLEMPPFWGATLRFAPAALLLFGLVLILKLPLPKGRALLGAILYGALNFGGSYAFLYMGIRNVLPGMAQVILALVPLFTLLFAVVHRQEAFHWKALVGSLLAVAGVAIVFSEQLTEKVPVTSLLAIVLGAVCFAESGVIAKGFPKSHPVTTNAIGMASGAMILFILSLIWREPQVLPVKTSTWLALIYLILFGSCAVFILFLYVLKYWQASTVSYSFVLLPFVALAASAWLTHEKLSPVLLIGAVLVLLGVYIGAIFSPRKNPAIKGANNPASIK